MVCVKVGRLVQKENSGSSPVCLLWVGPAWGSVFLFFHLCAFLLFLFLANCCYIYFLLLFSCFPAAISVGVIHKRFFFELNTYVPDGITLIFELTYLKTKKEKIKIWRTLKKLTACAANGMSPGIREASRSLSLPQPRNNSPDLWSHKVTLRARASRVERATDRNICQAE